MDKLEFNNLEILEQIDYINKELRKSKSIKEVVEKIGISRTTIRNRFKKEGYFYNKEKKKYEYIQILSDKFSWSRGDIEMTTPKKLLTVPKPYIMVAYPDGTVHDGDIRKGLTEIEKDRENNNPKE